MGPEEQEHSYEELREVVINVLLDARRNGVDRFEKLVDRTCVELSLQGGQGEPQSSNALPALHPGDAELVLEIVWDLFRQGVLTLGLDLSNPGWPWLRLSRFGECALQHGAYRFHNKVGFMKALRSETIDVSRDAVVYLREAISAFYTDCLLAACVMLGIAAESEFLRVLEAAKRSRIYGQYFSHRRWPDGSRQGSAVQGSGGRRAFPSTRGRLARSRRCVDCISRVPAFGPQRGGAIYVRALTRPGVCLSPAFHTVRRAADAVATQID